MRSRAVKPLAAKPLTAKSLAMEWRATTTRTVNGRRSGENHGIGVGTDHSATTRFLRVVAVATAFGSVVFNGLVLEPVLAQTPQLATWWWPFIALLFALPLVLGVAGVLGDPRTIRVIAGLYAIAYAVAIITWTPALAATGEAIGVDPPWIINVVTIATVCASIAWAAPISWAFLACMCVAVFAVRAFAGQLPPGDGSLLSVAVQDALAAAVFAGIFSAVLQATFRAGASVDRAAAAAADATALAAATDAHERENTRYAALLHDDVLSVLTATASGRASDELLRRYASSSLDKLSSYHASDAPEQSVGSAELVEVVRAAATAGGGDVRFAASGALSTVVPHEVATAISEAVAEAVRNSQLHAGADAVPSVIVVLDGSGVQVLVRDSGSGFDASQIAPGRLGIEISIRRRMSAIDGGFARVDSTPGVGTTVHLGWSAP